MGLDKTTVGVSFVLTGGQTLQQQGLQRSAAVYVSQHSRFAGIFGQRKMLAVHHPQQARPGLSAQRTNHVNTGCRVRRSSGIRYQLQGFNDDRDILERSARCSVRVVQHMLQITISGLAEHAIELFSQPLFQCLQNKLLGKLMLAQSDPIMPWRQPGFEHLLVRPPDVQFSDHTLEVVGIQRQRQGGTIA